MLDYKEIIEMFKVTDRLTIELIILDRLPIIVLLNLAADIEKVIQQRLTAQVVSFNSPPAPECS